MKRFRRAAVWALLSGVLAALIVPFLVPVETSGTLTEREAAGPGAEFVEVGGLSVHVETATYSGESADPPVIVLLHGFGASTFSWREVLQPLAVLGDVVAYDRPAFGFTERPTGWQGENPYGVPGNLALLDAVIDRFADARDVILVGHSAGGLVAGEYARLHPDRVDRLVLVAPAVLGGGGPPAWLTPVLGLPQIDRLGPLLVQGIASSGDQILEQSFADPAALTDAVRAGYRAPLTVIGWEAALWRFTTSPRDNALATNLDALSVPTLLITGSTDTIVATADTERLATLLPDVELVVIPNAGHLPHEERPEQFVAALLTWLGASTT
ncbi:alpha/beta fold hydrolase [Microcella frigidaquae]|uniref:Pimeloyl-ACP methyl ester carboxylesterase n=1 Tax=Microcella frigidaquae TaxID=424758 RepID=A0A840XFS2_9MICO|nr:alpha/beta hydrolase [Microcella frigidaquae]MBB5617186.1 pimeloyl-ACP methyl ester carboxylesterase [Microcella frigidaquae]NHN45114.1 alpha/beta hydrolase [Microcella frigidaquae]